MNKITIRITWPGQGEATFEVGEAEALAYFANRGYGEGQAALENLAYAVGNGVQQEGSEILAREA
jgi:hypothetical protein